MSRQSRTLRDDVAKLLAAQFVSENWADLDGSERQTCRLAASAVLQRVAADPLFRGQGAIQRPIVRELLTP